MKTTGKTPQSNEYQLVSSINTSLDNLFMLNVLEYIDNSPLHTDNMMLSYMDFEYNEQTN